MNPEEMFNWPDGDVILRATHGASDSRDFRVHKLFLSFSSPVFRDMFKIPQPSSPSSVPSEGVDVVDVTDPPRALDLVLRFVYPTADVVVTQDLTILSEALAIADKYDIGVARSRLRPSFMEFAVTEPLRAYAIACRLGLEDEKKVASSHTTSIHLPGLAELPEEFESISATEYHRLILLHSKYRREVAAIASRMPLTGSSFVSLVGELLLSRGDAEGRARAREATRRRLESCITEGIPLNHTSLAHLLKAENDAAAFSDTEIKLHVSSILSQANALYLTV